MMQILPRRTVYALAMEFYRTANFRNYDKSESREYHVFNWLAHIITLMPNPCPASQSMCVYNLNCLPLWLCEETMPQYTSVPGIASRLFHVSPGVMLFGTCNRLHRSWLWLRLLHNIVRWYCNHSRVNMVVADDMVPIWRQGICHHHVGICWSVRVRLLPL